MKLIELVSYGFSFISIYVVTWLMVIFMVLPINISKKNTSDFGSSAPDEPQIKKKFIINSLISLVISSYLYYLIVLSDFSFREFIMKL